MKKRTPKLSAAKLVRTMARAQVGPVPPSAVVPDRRQRPEKHKRDLARHPPQE
ncbi:MAG: hypothetical protein ACRD1E_02030 [Terriglobales bacterium]